MDCSLRRWRRSTWVASGVAIAIALATGLDSRTRAASRQDEDDDAKLRLRASPRVAFAPANILFVGDLRGGPDDNEELYCTTIEWDWGDDTKSEQTPDCDPFEPGTTEIRRRFSVRHTYAYGGRYDVRLHLKRRDDVVISARTSIEVRGTIDRFR